jgi:hypothetical protein
VGEREPGPKLSAIDAIQTSTRHLHKAQARAGRGHLFAEPHGDQNVGIPKVMQDSSLVARDDLAADAEAATDRLGQPHGKRSRKSSFHELRPFGVPALVEQCLAREYRGAKVSHQLPARYSWPRIRASRYD